MRVLVTGANGFIGRNVVAELSADHEVYKAMQVVTEDTPNSIAIELKSKESIRSALTKIRPDAIINCAGIVINTNDAHKNAEYTENIFREVIYLEKPYPKVVVMGSASEYGVVEDARMPVGEDHPLNPVGDYAHSKVDEVRIAQAYAREHGIDVVVARIFNPIGPGMGDKFLLTSLLKQINDIKQGHGSEIALSRLDSRRDYVDVRDAARAIRLFVEKRVKNHQVIQNIGSGKSTTNRYLLEVLLSKVELSQKPTIIETRVDPEPTYAARADISRIKAEYDWEPSYNLNTTIEDIIHE